MQNHFWEILHWSTWDGSWKRVNWADMKATESLSSQQLMYINVTAGWSHSSSLMRKKKRPTAGCSCCCRQHIVVSHVRINNKSSLWQTDLSASAKLQKILGPKEKSVFPCNAAFTSFSRQGYYLCLCHREITYYTQHYTNSIQHKKYICSVRVVNIAWIAFIHPNFQPLLSFQSSACGSSAQLTFYVFFNI